MILFLSILAIWAVTGLLILTVTMGRGGHAFWGDVLLVGIGWPLTALMFPVYWIGRKIQKSSARTKKVLAVVFCAVLILSFTACVVVRVLTALGYHL